jgi:hypothetical protein
MKLVGLKTDPILTDRQSRCWRPRFRVLDRTQGGVGGGLTRGPAARPVSAEDSVKQEDDRDREIRELIDESTEEPSGRKIPPRKSPDDDSDEYSE